MSQSFSIFVFVPLYFCLCLSLFLSVSFYFCLCQNLSLSLSLSLSLCVSIAFSISVFVSFYFCLCLSLFLPLTKSLFLSLPLSFSISLSFSLFCLGLSLYMPISLSVCLSHSLSFSVSPCLCIFLSISCNYYFSFPYSDVSKFQRLITEAFTMLCSRNVLFFEVFSSKESNNCLFQRKDPNEQKLPVAECLKIFGNERLEIFDTPKNGKLIMVNEQ